MKIFNQFVIRVMSDSCTRDIAKRVVRLGFSCHVSKKYISIDLAFDITQFVQSVQANTILFKKGLRR